MSTGQPDRLPTPYPIVLSLKRSLLGISHSYYLMRIAIERAKVGRTANYAL